MCSKEDCYIVETGYWENYNKKVFIRKKFLPYSLLNYIVIKKNNKGIFHTIYRYNTEKQDDAFLYGDFYLDFDDEDNFETVREDAIKAISYLKVVFKIENVKDDINIYFSGNKGIHLIVSADLLGIEPNKNLNEIFKTIAEAISVFTPNKTLDLRIYDRKRMFRIPGSIHEKTGLHKIQITYDELLDATPEEIKIKAKTVNCNAINRKKHCTNYMAKKMFKVFSERTEEKIYNLNRNIKPNKRLSYTPPCIKNILTNGVGHGKRNNTTAILASFLKASGTDKEKATNIILDWNFERCKEPNSKTDIIKTINSIYSRNKYYGCNAIRNLDLCLPQDCKFNKN